MTTLSTEFLDLQMALAGEYSLERELGRGGMGVVYLARDVQLDRHVAIKVLPAHLASEPESRERFLREARTAAGLSHPNIVPIHRVGEVSGFVFFVMGYVAGQTLGDWLRTKGPLPAADAMRVLREVSWALAYAHGHGIVHRDVKPDNILLEEGSGRALVTDFGIAHVGSTTLSTDPGKIMGTAQFMSPEQAMSEDVDGRSDLYSLGVVGYLAVSGRLPFEAANVPALLMKQVSEPARSVAETSPGVPSSLAAAIDRCLQKDPASRFQTGEALADALSPPGGGKPHLPAPLRSWLGTRNPAAGAYMAWSGFLMLPLLSDLIYMLRYQHGRWQNVVVLLSLATGPLIPIVGFHASQARRLFRTGFTLNDLREALAVGARERADGERLVARDAMSFKAHVLRAVTYASVIPAVGVTFFFEAIRSALLYGHRWPTLLKLSFDNEVVFALGLGTWVLFASLLIAINMNDVPLLPSAVRRFFRVGLRERLWRSTIGVALAKRLGAPATSNPVGVGVFRATEVALGVAAGDLFAALPQAYREQLAALPSIVAALEARAAAARADVEMLDAQPTSANHPEDALHSRRDAARSQLGSSVAALEGIRLDLLRLHAGASDLMPLTTLLDAAKLLGEDVDRLAAAQQQVAMRSPNRPHGAGRVATPT